MATYLVTPKDRFEVPVECRYLRPDKFAGKTLKEIGEFIAYEGGVKRRLADLFDVEGPERAPEDPEEIEIHVKGARKIRYLGYKMTSGTIVIEEDAGDLLGYRMRGGRIVVKGNAGSWLGVRMRGGEIEVEGSAGDFIGASLPGDDPGKGLRKGIIVIKGNAGSNVGAGMGSGAVIVEGSAGHLVGAGMTGGSILIMGRAGRFIGARARGGKIVIGGEVDGLLPSYYIDDVVSKAKVKGRVLEGSFLLLRGDSVVDGKARLYISEEGNPSLSYLRNLVEEVEVL